MSFEQYVPLSSENKPMVTINTYGHCVFNVVARQEYFEVVPYRMRIYFDHDTQLLAFKPVEKNDLTAAKVGSHGRQLRVVVTGVLERMNIAESALPYTCEVIKEDNLLIIDLSGLSVTSNQRRENELMSGTIQLGAKHESDTCR